MRGTGMLVGAGIRRRWRALVVLTIITALGCGFALTALTGAARTHTSWKRLLDSTYGPQVLANVPSSRVDAIRAEIAARPDVAEAGAFSFMPAAVKGMRDADQQGLFAGLGPGFGTTIVRPLIDKGRLADPARADEITVNAAYAKLARVDVGSRVTLVGSGIALEQPATVVGIHRSPLDIGANGGAPLALATPAFMAKWWPTLKHTRGFAEIRPAIAVRFRPGTNLEAALRDLSKSLPPEVGLTNSAALNNDVEKGLTAGTTAYVILAIASALATILLLIFLVGRAMRVRAAEASLLAALGATRPARAFAIWAPFALALATGVVAAPFLAIIASPLVRTGFAKIADPVHGIWVDAGDLALAGPVLLVVLLVGATMSAWHAAAPGRDTTAEPRRASPLQRFDRVSATAEIGAWAAFGGSSARTRRLARSTLVAFSAALCCLVAALVWIASVSNLGDDFRLQGWNFDVAATSLAGTGPAALKEVEATLAQRPDVLRFASYRQTTLPVLGNDVDVFSLPDERGGFSPMLRSGRLPQTAHESVVGHDIARHGGRVGKELVLRGPHGSLPTTIVGEVVFPFLGNTGFGDTVIITNAAMNQIAPVEANSGLLIDLAPGTDPAAVHAALGGHFTIYTPFSPPPIQRLHEATSIYFALVTFFALLAFVLFGFATVTNTQRRFREYAVVRAIGFTRRQVFAAFRWQALVSLLVAAVFAIPIGIVLGRGAWELSARNLGVFDAWSVPFGRLGIGLVAGAIVMTAIATAVAIRPARENLAYALRAE